jgi:predicted nucleotidyltransferase
MSSPPDIVELIRHATLAAAQRVFGALGVTAEVQGSMIKGTAMKGSDLDILVHTPQPAKREQQRQLVKELKQDSFFHADHVRLGRLAIHVKGIIDIDIVCANTTQYGQQGVASARFANNPAARDAVLSLKYLVGQAQPADKVPNFHLEMLVVRVQSELMGEDSLAAGSAGPQVPATAAGPMQLLLRTLMVIVDDEPQLRSIGWFGDIVSILRVSATQKSETYTPKP